ncbi:MAG: 5'/3'-nucleotidase SurE [Gammaproteobacteria bacterium]|jgi:5'-nucleotidase
MKILLSNDDGVYAPGIRVLYESLKTIATVKVVAPDRDRSAASKSLTLNKPIYAMEIDNGFMLVDGTPTDCVHYALSCQDFLKDFSIPDMVVAGINNGANLGDDVLYSGTVAVATEGRFLGFPSVAISLAGDGGCKHYATAGKVAQNIVRRLMQKPLTKDTILNINIPDVPYEQIKGYQITRLGSRHQAENMIKMKDPRGKIGYWIGLAGTAQDAGVGTDFYAIKNGYVSITPLKMDVTHYDHIEPVRSWAESLEY